MGWVYMVSFLTGEGDFEMSAHALSLAISETIALSFDVDDNAVVE